VSAEVEFEVQRESCGFWEAGYWDKHLPSLEAARSRMADLATYAEPDPMRIVRVTREVVTGESAE